MSDLVHGVGELCHGLLCSLDLREIGLQRFTDIDELVVKCISTLGYSDLKLFIILWRPFVLLKPSVGIDCSTAGCIVLVLALPRKLTKFSVWRHSDVRREQNH